MAGFNDQQEEIDRIRGELIAARGCIALLMLCAFDFGAPSLRHYIVAKIRDFKFVGPSEFTGEGFDNFKERLLSALPDNPEDERSEHD